MIKEGLFKIIRFGGILHPELESANFFILGTKISPDLSLAKCYIRFINEDEANKILVILNGVSGKIRHELARTLNLRRTPKIQFLHSAEAPDSMDM